MATRSHNREQTMIDNNHELTICELDAVNGGFIREIISAIAEILKSPEPPSGGQNDPAQQFQQILNSLTQGQG
jgi:hypothetical protein